MAIVFAVLVSFGQFGTGALFLCGIMVTVFSYSHCGDYMLYMPEPLFLQDKNLCTTYLFFLELVGYFKELDPVYDYFKNQLSEIACSRG